jgi:hypothetical protein
MSLVYVKLTASVLLKLSGRQLLLLLLLLNEAYYDRHRTNYVNSSFVNVKFRPFITDFKMTMTN